MSIEFNNINQIKEYANKITSDVAKRIAKELTHEANNVLLEFYSSYDPKYYRRHENFIRKFKPQKYYHNGGQIFSGGVKLLTDSIPNVYQDKPSTVANFVYNGLHGWASVNWHGSVSPMKPSPLNIINKKRDKIIKNIQKYIDEVK